MKGENWQAFSFIYILLHLYRPLFGVTDLEISTCLSTMRTSYGGFTKQDFNCIYRQ